MIGYTREEYEALVQNCGADACIHPEDGKSVMENVRGVMRSGEPLNYTYRALNRQGVIMWLHARGEKIKEEQGCPIYDVVLMNVTAEKMVQDNLMYRAEYDTLTGIYNRSSFYRRNADCAYQGKI